MEILLPIKPKKASPTSSPIEMNTMQDVIDYVDSNGPPHLAGPLKTLKRNLFGASPQSLKISDFDITFPKSVRGIHPRPDLPQRLSAYKPWREKCRRAIAEATGAVSKKEQLRARQDGWSELQSVVKLHTKDGGQIAPQSISPLARFADIARRANLEPWELAGQDALDRLEAVLHAKTDRKVARSAQKTLNDYSYLPELAVLLPAEPVAVLPSLRELDVLPEHIDSFISAMADKAATKRDRVAGKDAIRVEQTTRNRYVTALRHHLRALPHCQPHRDPDPRIDYPRPVGDLAPINDVAGLFTLDHLCASIRRTEEVEHLPGTLSQASAYSYYTIILAVLARNGMLDDDAAESIQSSVFLQRGKEISEGMRPETQRWCEQLLEDPTREKRFRNMHRLMMREAKAVMAVAKEEGRALSDREVSRVRALGTCAAASAIEWSGAPIRMANCLGLRYRGSRRNFFLPDAASNRYRFFLTKEETKSGAAFDTIELEEAMYGPEVLAWYFAEIRPLFPYADGSIYLFPGVATQGKPLDRGTFDTWFQRSAGECGLHMSFHRWRHGYATLMVDESWSNLKAAADMLGNSMGVCESNYAFIQKKKLYKEGQQILVERANRKDLDEVGLRK